MILVGQVQDAKMSDFLDVEVTVVDKQVMRPVGGRPQYTCRIVRGLPEVEHLKQLKKAHKKGEKTEAEVMAFASQMTLPPEDAILQLQVLDVTGKNGYVRFLCEVVS